MPHFITDEDVERALDFLTTNSIAAAKARAERSYVEDYAKVIKALIMKEHAGSSGIVQEREAYADGRYLQHLEAIRMAVEEDSKMTFLRQAAVARIEAWRTQCSNERGVKL